jgi:hypothetical protein
MQGWFAADITDYARRALGAWSSDGIAAYLKTAHTPTSIATGLMAETISQSTSHMSDADLKAIATYLKNQSGQQADDNPAPLASDQLVMKTGAKIYATSAPGATEQTAREPQVCSRRSAARRSFNRPIPLHSCM